MRSSLRTLLRRKLLEAGFEVTRVTASESGEAVYSTVGPRVAELLDQLGISAGVVVDIGAADGKQGSNSYALFSSGFTGLAVDANANMFMRLSANLRELDVALHRGFVTPVNVLELLASAGIPQSFAFLSLDIDSYDRDVLATIWSRHRPLLVCAEVLEVVPPPVRFTIEYSPEFSYPGGHCYGMSLQSLCDLGVEHDYVLVDLILNNAILAPRDAGLTAVDPVEAYRRGYVERVARHTMMPWNADFEQVLSMPADEAQRWLQQHPEFVAGQGFARWG